MRDRARLVLRTTGVLIAASAIVLTSFGGVSSASALPATAAHPVATAPVFVRRVVYRRLRNGRYQRVLIMVRVIRRTPAPVPVRVGNPNDPMWQCIIWRESRGNPRAVNRSSGAGGLFQFLPSSWRVYGGTGLPQNATVAEQWRIALNAYVRSGWQPWGGGCHR